MRASVVDGERRSAEEEISRGDRFAFGENWSRFLDVLDDGRIEDAVSSLQELLEVDSLRGKSFLDVGCGSGLSSLAARRLGASVRAFDFDSSSVACARELKRRYCPGDEAFEIEEGSVVDEAYVGSLGAFDIVYSWGVLHHTGAMYRALENVKSCVRPGGKLFISIYNDQGGTSRRWRLIKRLYNRAPRFLKTLIVLSVAFGMESRYALARLANFQNPLPFSSWRRKSSRDRGMSVWHDYVDWVGGYPFEVARPEEIFHFFRKAGFVLDNLRTSGGGHGCNQYVFSRAE